MLKLLSQSEDERTKGVVQFQSRVRSPALDPVARLLTKLSDEAFIVGVFPPIIWGPYCDSMLVWHFCLTIGFGFAFGNMLKNITCRRRPMSPPTWIDYTSSEEYEFSMPSTHALNSMAMSLVLALHHLFAHDHRASWVMILFWLVFPLIWCGAISLSRVYLGAHAIPDIVAGSFLGLVFGVVIYVTSEFIRLHGNLFTTVLGMFVVFAMMLWHPVDRSTPLNFHFSEGTFDNTPTLLGVALGSISGRYFFPNPDISCTPHFNMKLLLRYVIFLPIALALYIGFKSYVPPLIELFLKKMGVPANYVPYHHFREYVIQSLKAKGVTPGNSASSSPLSSSTPSPAASLSSSLSSIPSSSFSPSALPDCTDSSEENSTNNGNGTTHENGKNGSASSSPPTPHPTYSNPKMLLCYTRLWGKLFLYTFLTWLMAICIPLVFRFTGL